MTCVTMGTAAAGIFAPALFWTGYFYYKDRFKPEPLVKFGSSYVLGFAAAWLCLKSFGLLPVVGIPDDPSALMASRGVRLLFYSILVTGLVEEAFKFMPFVLISRRYCCFDEKTDGVIYASAIALGFASFENLFQLQALAGWELLGRAFASPLTHTIFASLWGYPVGLARLRKRRLLWPSIYGLALAATAHGLFNFFTTSVELRAAAAVFILAIWIWRIWIMEKPEEAKKGRRTS